MKKMIALLIVLLMTACATTDPYEIDPEATAKAKWKIGGIVYEDTYTSHALFRTYKRYFLGVAKDGNYVVRHDIYQEYTEEGWKMIKDDFSDFRDRILKVKSDPYLIPEKYTETDRFMVNGSYIDRYPDGKKNSECHYLKAGTSTVLPCTVFYESGEKFMNEWFFNGNVVNITTYYKNGVRREEMHLDKAGKEILLHKKWDKQGNLLEEIRRI